MLENLASWMAALVRPPRTAGPPRSAPQPWLPPISRLAIGAAGTIAVVALAMLLLDAPAIRHHAAIPRWLVVAFGAITDFGKSEWFLVPSGLLLVIVAAAASPAAGRTTYLVLTSLAARLGFVFVAVALPSLFTTIVKRMIGRARPVRVEDLHTLIFVPFSWRVEYASLPSGHSTTAFAAAVALGAVFPRARAVFWIYAAGIALSRVVLTVHYPSDVLAGAVVGAGGALLIRRWFAARRLAFALRPDGSVLALPGPSLHRIKKVARAVSGQ
jgi:undecaprenyl-diphosphatase